MDITSFNALVSSSTCSNTSKQKTPSKNFFLKGRWVRSATIHLFEKRLNDLIDISERSIKNPDLSKIPLLYHLNGDGGRYGSATVSTIKDHDTGRNVSYHRLMEIDKNKFTARLIKNRQTKNLINIFLEVSTNIFRAWIESITTKL